MNDIRYVDGRRDRAFVRPAEGRREKAGQMGSMFQ
jgi:hypothetical protein